MPLSNKYSDEEIVQMCHEVLLAKRDSDPRYPQFLMVMSLLTHLDPHEIEDKILKCVQTGKWEE